MDASALTEHQKRERVLSGATEQFLAYGYKRVTMETIAKSADMSRPALYLLYGNKQEIYRAITDRKFESSLEAIAATLKTKGPLTDRLTTMINRDMFGLLEEINASPHGAELLDLKTSLAPDLLAGWFNAITAVVRDAIAAEAALRGIDLNTRGLTASGLADMLLDGIEGMKRRASTVDAQQAGTLQLVRMIDLALTA